MKGQIGGGGETIGADQSIQLIPSVGVDGYATGDPVHRMPNVDAGPIDGP